MTQFFKNRLGKSRPALWRVLEIRKTILSGSYPNCSSLAKEIEVTPKTIQRDISFMREQLGFPVVYHPIKNGYYFDGDVSDLSLLQLSRQDLVALFLARHALEPLRGTRLQTMLADSFSKIAEACSGEVSIHWHELDEVYSVKATGVLEADVTLFGDLLDAIQERREISFDYHKLAASQSELRTVRPYHVGQVEHGWYLIAYDLKRKSMRTFALQRISDLKISKKTFSRDSKFNAVEYLGSAFGIWNYDESTAKEYQIRVRFEGYAARIVAERQWHATQKIVQLEEGCIEFQATLSGLEEIRRWILSWGSKACVLEPRELRESIQDELSAMSEAYR